MSKKLLLIAALVSIVVFGGCVRVNTPQIKIESTGEKETKISPLVKRETKISSSVKSVAVVSLAVSDWGGSVKDKSIAGESVHSLMRSATDGMLIYTEKELARHWKVKTVDAFINNAGYRKAAEDIRAATFSPIVNGREMPLFGVDFKKGDITAKKARNLCAALQVDAVVLVFSEWTVKIGGFVPITRAMSKNVVSFWNKKGEKIYFRRIDVAGKKPIGAFGVKAVNQGTIKQWTWGYETALKKMFTAI